VPAIRQKFHLRPVQISGTGSESELTATSQETTGSVAVFLIQSLNAPGPAANVDTVIHGNANLAANANVSNTIDQPVALGTGRACPDRCDAVDSGRHRHEYNCAQSVILVLEASN
jgi:hypothetical protein